MSVIAPQVAVQTVFVDWTKVMSWTDERIDILKSLWDSGLTASQIAEKLGGGISRNAVIGKAHRLELKSRPSPVKAGDDSAAAAPAAAKAAPKAAKSAPEPAAVAKPIPEIARPRIAPRPIAAPVKSGKTTLLDLSDKVCKWPIGHPGETDFHFCGKPSNPSFPYCLEHCAQAYQAQLPRRDRPGGGRPFPGPPGVRIR